MSRVTRLIGKFSATALTLRKRSGSLSAARPSGPSRRAGGFAAMGVGSPSGDTTSRSLVFTRSSDSIGSARLVALISPLREMPVRRWRRRSPQLVFVETWPRCKEYEWAAKMAPGVAGVNLWKTREVPYPQTHSYSTRLGTLHSVDFPMRSATNMVLYAAGAASPE